MKTLLITLLLFPLFVSFGYSQEESKLTKKEMKVYQLIVLEIMDSIESRSNRLSGDLTTLYTYRMECKEYLMLQNEIEKKTSLALLHRTSFKRLPQSDLFVLKDVLREYAADLAAYEYWVSFELKAYKPKEVQKELDYLFYNRHLKRTWCLLWSTLSSKLPLN